MRTLAGPRTGPCPNGAPTLPARSTVEGSRSQSNLRGARLIQVSDLKRSCQLETSPPVPQVELVPNDEDTSWEGRGEVTSVAKPKDLQLLHQKVKVIIFDFPESESGNIFFTRKCNSLHQPHQPLPPPILQDQTSLQALFPQPHSWNKVLQKSYL